jgi:hypothetical protein
MAAPHNIFSDTVIGGTVSFLQAPAAVTPAAILGRSSSLVMGDVTAAALRTYIGISASGTEGTLARFGASQALVNSRLSETLGSPFTVTVAASLNVANDLVLPSQSSPGTTPANLKVMVADGTSVRFLSPPTPAAGENWFLKMTTTGLSWHNGAPGGGGGGSGPTGSGTPDRVVKWVTASTLGDSLITSTTTETTVDSILTVKIAGVQKSRLQAAQWDLSAAVLGTDLSAPASASTRFMVLDGDQVRPGTNDWVRAWLGVYTSGQVDGLLSGYVPLSGGTMSGTGIGTGPGSGSLLLQGTSPSPGLSSPVVQQKAATGASVGTWTNGTGWALFQGTQTWTHVRNCLEYDFNSGSFSVWQNVSGTWQNLAVATQAWASANFLTGIGTNTYVAIWNSSSTLTQSILSIFGGDTLAVAGHVSVQNNVGIAGTLAVTGGGGGASVIAGKLSLPSDSSIVPLSSTTPAFLFGRDTGSGSESQRLRQYDAATVRSWIGIVPNDAIASLIVVTVGEVTSTYVGATFQDVTPPARAGMSLTLPANTIAAGNVLKLEMAGFIKGPDALQAEFRVSLGSYVMDVHIAEPGSSGPSLGCTWTANIWITVQSTGTAVSPLMRGVHAYENGDGLAGSVYSTNYGLRSKFTAGGTLNTTVPNTLKLEYKGTTAQAQEFRVTNAVLWRL